MARRPEPGREGDPSARARGGRPARQRVGGDCRRQAWSWREAHSGVGEPEWTVPQRHIRRGGIPGLPAGPGDVLLHQPATGQADRPTHPGVPPLHPEQGRAASGCPGCHLHTAADADGHGIARTPPMKATEDDTVKKFLCLAVIVVSAAAVATQHAVKGQFKETLRATLDPALESYKPPMNVD